MNLIQKYSYINAIKFSNIIMVSAKTEFITPNTMVRGQVAVPSKELDHFAEIITCADEAANLTITQNIDRSTFGVDIDAGKACAKLEVCAADTFSEGKTSDIYIEYLGASCSRTSRATTPNSNRPLGSGAW